MKISFVANFFFFVFVFEHRLQYRLPFCPSLTGPGHLILLSCTSVSFQIPIFVTVSTSIRPSLNRAWASHFIVVSIFVPASQGLGISFCCLSNFSFSLTGPGHLIFLPIFASLFCPSLTGPGHLILLSCQFSSQPHKAWASHFIVSPIFVPASTGPGHLILLSRQFSSQPHRAWASQSSSSLARHRCRPNLFSQV